MGMAVRADAWLLGDRSLDEYRNRRGWLGLLRPQPRKEHIPIRVRAGMAPMNQAEAHSNAGLLLLAGLDA